MQWYRKVIPLQNEWSRTTFPGGNDAEWYVSEFWSDTAVDAIVISEDEYILIFDTVNSLSHYKRM